MVIPGLVLALVLSVPCSAQENTVSDEKKIIESYNKTALQLYLELREDSQGGNLVISPYSIGTAMTMALLGARGDTEKEMAKVLNQTISKEQINLANSKILAKINRFGAEKDVVLSTANALSLTSDAALVHQDYKTLLKTKYHAEIFRAQNVDRINAWVAQKKGSGDTYTYSIIPHAETKAYSKLTMKAIPNMLLQHL